MPNRLIQLFAEDPRYTPDAYAFVLAALHHTQETLGRSDKEELASRHVSARELLEGVRELGLLQFGRLALPVLPSWGLASTSDVGEIVYNLIRYEQMSKTDSDQRGEFDDVYDFEEVFHRQFKISMDKVQI